jgi:hypothetical protein
MTAIITDILRANILNELVTDIADSASNYYVAIGRSEDWDSADAVPLPLNSTREVRNLQHSLQSMIAVGASTYTVPRANWSQGTIYSGYDDAVVGHPSNAYFVLNDNNQVFMCIRPGRDTFGVVGSSTVQPSGTSVAAYETADGYVWKLCYALSALQSNTFLAANFLPCQFIDSAGPGDDPSVIQQEEIQAAAIPGQINVIKLSKNGSGYTGVPTVTIVGNGTGARATATVSGGVVSKVEIDDSSGTLLMGTGYTYANVSITGGGAADSNVAEGRISLSPAAGFGADARIDLRSTALMFNAKPEGALNDDFVIGNDFRQITLVRNPTDEAGAPYTLATGSCLRHMKFGSITVPFTPDKTIEGAESLSRAWVDYVDSSDTYYHQNEQTGFGSFNEGELVAEIDGSGSGVLQGDGVDGDSDAYVVADINRYSGEVLYIDNRAAVVRSAEQTEDIKIIIKV